METALKLHAADVEATDFQTRLTASKSLTGTPLKAAVTADGFEPIARIRRTYSEASFRQAAFQMDQMRAIRMATLPPAERASQYIKLGRDYLAAGLVPEAEQEFESALTADPRSAPAHAGLAQIRQQSGDVGNARTEAQASLTLQPNAAAWLVLARLELQANNLPASASDVSSALHLEPANTAVLGMKQALANRGQSIP